MGTRWHIMVHWIVDGGFPARWYVEKMEAIVASANKHSSGFDGVVHLGKQSYRVPRQWNRACLKGM